MTCGDHRRYLCADHDCFFALSISASPELPTSDDGTNSYRGRVLCWLSRLGHKAAAIWQSMIFMRRSDNVNKNRSTRQLRDMSLPALALASRGYSPNFSEPPVRGSCGPVTRENGKALACVVLRQCSFSPTVNTCRTVGLPVVLCIPIAHGCRSRHQAQPCRTEEA
ncbi:hypothetical protein VTO42DRAFT_1510 [Malbranchea cinnamomea]